MFLKNSLFSLKFFIFLVLIICHYVELTYSSRTKEEVYMRARNQLTSYSSSGHDWSVKEKAVSFYLEKLKRDENAETPLMNMNENSELYQMLRRMPKGGNLHLHEIEALSRPKFLNFIFSSDKLLEWLYICDEPVLCTTTPYHMRYFSRNIGDKNGWTRVKGSNWTVDSIVQKTTLSGLLLASSDSAQSGDGKEIEKYRWNLAIEGGVFDAYSQLLRHAPSRYKYIKLLIEAFASENVHFLELRRDLVSDLFEFDDQGQEISLSESEEMNAYRKLKRKLQQMNPMFVDFVFIIYESRLSSKAQVEHTLHGAIRLHQIYPDLVVAFDLVGYEDMGHSLLYYLDTLNSINDSSSFRYVFHAAETNWHEDAKWPWSYDDNVNTLENIYDAILLGSKRIGHALGLIQHPELYSILKEREIAIEVCPTSNEMLGYVTDLRNHPAINFYRSGLSLVLASDDPGSFGFSTLSREYYVAFKTWSLDLHALREIANNSIRFSLLSIKKKNEAFALFESAWLNFVSDTYQSHCSLMHVFDFMHVNVSGMLPTRGNAVISHIDQSDDLTLYGHGFDSLICYSPFICLFGKIRTHGYLHKLGQIRCSRPSFISINQTTSVPVNIWLQVVSLKLETGFNYTFIVH